MLFDVETFLADLLWQDVVLAVGQVVFVFALIPMIRTLYKPPRITCVIHGVVLASFGVAFASLDLWFSALSVWMVSGLWFYIGLQQRLRTTSSR